MCVRSRVVSRKTFALLKLVGQEFNRISRDLFWITKHMGCLIYCCSTQPSCKARCFAKIAKKVYKLVFLYSLLGFKHISGAIFFKVDICINQEIFSNSVDIGNWHRCILIASYDNKVG